MSSTLSIRRSEQGFTLVELAIVMIIIGLLLGGLLKGQELISNARVASTVSAIKNIESATTTFRDKYNGMPGDLLTPATRLVNCIGPCAVAAGVPRGNGLVDDGGGFAAVPTLEALGFFPQLFAANLITGIVPAAAGVTWGTNWPSAPIGGGFHVSYMPGNAAMPNLSTNVVANVRSGHYLALHNQPGGGVAGGAVANAPLTATTPNQAFRIDAKLDDGQPSSGSVLAAGITAAVAPAVACATVNTVVGVYSETIDTTACNLYIRFQD